MDRCFLGNWRQDSGQGGLNQLLLYSMKDTFGGRQFFQHLLHPPQEIGEMVAEHVKLFSK